jgi:LysR family hydrogen peroxide-inducible transcriptional activator
MPTLSQLEYIVSLSKFKHFGRAAEHCHISQPSLSTQIQKVEEELGLIIFDRSKKPIMETDQGKKVIAQAKKVISEHEKIFSIVHEGRDVAGKFHLGVIPTLSAYIIPLFVESFAKKYPKVELRISEYKTEEIIAKLYDDELDGGLLVTPLYDSKIIERSLFFEPFYAYVSPNHKFSKRKSLKDDELDAEDLWLLNEGHCFRNQVLNLCSMKADSRVLPNVEFESGSLETLKNLIRQGRGYTLLPYLASKSLDQKEKEVMLKKFQKPIPTREVSLVHSRDFLKEEIINAIVDEIVHNIPDELMSLKKGNIQVVDI